MVRVWTTNGRWDVIAALGTEMPEAFDRALFAIRRLDGVTTLETSLLLSTRKTG